VAGSAVSHACDVRQDGDVNAEVIASITTAAGTLVLAVATYFSTRSANSASRVAERALLVGLQPVLMHGRIDDPVQKVGFGDEHWVHLKGPGAAFEVGDEAIYLAIAVRNAGSGIAVLQGWRPTPRRDPADQARPSLAEFRMQTRDLFIPAGDVGFWQGALRDKAAPEYGEFETAARNRKQIVVDLLYTDLHGGQRTISRYLVTPAGEDGWIAAVARHWIIDGVSPR
jgi:hypothetical protein